MNIPSVSHWRSGLLIVVASLACPTYGLADVYRSVDAQGHVVYSDQADMSAAQQPVDVGTSTSGADADMHATEAPPQLPDNEQPPCPEEGYLWTPGYWAWSPAGYYWVQGAWVQPPRVGVLWTPGYWGWVDTVYLFHRGYWAPHIGYYGGINYGFGYFGVGFAGGRWVGNSFAYNGAVANVNEHAFHNVYREGVANDTARSRVSFNGPGGSNFAPTAQERQFAAESHIPPTSQQHQMMVQAARTPARVPQTTARMNVPQPEMHKAVAVSAPTPRIDRNIAAASSVSQREPVRAMPPPLPRTPAAAQPAVVHPKSTTPTHPAPRITSSAH
jgi:hypothetical protein